MSFLDTTDHLGGSLGATGAPSPSGDAEAGRGPSQDPPAEPHLSTSSHTEMAQGWLSSMPCSSGVTHCAITVTDTLGERVCEHAHAVLRTESDTHPELHSSPGSILRSVLLSCPAAQAGCTRVTFLPQPLRLWGLRCASCLADAPPHRDGDIRPAPNSGLHRHAGAMQGCAGGP